jgi:hypothetical protein
MVMAKVVFHEILRREGKIKIQQFMARGTDFV